MRPGRIAVTVLALSMVAILGLLAAEWLAADINRVDPAHLAERDIAASRYRVLCVSQGWGCQVQGIGPLNYARCYSHAATFEMLGPEFGDVIVGGDDMLNRSRHVEFASRYNLTVAGALDKLGKRGCPAGEDWDALVESVGRAVSQLDIVPGYPHVNVSHDAAPGGHYFWFTTDYPAYVNTAVRSAICDNAARHGVRHRVWVAVGPNSPGPSDRLRNRFQCEAGKLVD